MTDVAAVDAEYVYGAGPHGEIVRSRKLP